MICKVGCIVQDIFGNELIITDVDMKELTYTVYNLTDEKTHGRIFAENQKRKFDQIHLLLDDSKRPLFDAGDKVIWVKKLNTNGSEQEHGVIVGPPKFNTELKVFGYSVMFKRELGYHRGFVLETHLVKDERKEPIKSILELLIEVGTQINADNPGYICEVTKCDAPYAAESLSVVFKCMVTHPHLCEKRVIALHDAEDGAEKLPNFICTVFTKFKQTCEQQRMLENAKIDYTKFFNNGPKIYDKTDCSELIKILMNGVYGANGNVYKGGYVYPVPSSAAGKRVSLESVCKDDSPSKKLAELAPYVTKGLADGINSEPDKDFLDAFRYSMILRPYDNAFAKYCKNDVDCTNKLFEEELGMNVTKVNKKQEAELTEYYQNVPWPYRPKKIIFNGPATIVIWADDTKTVVKCGKNEEYDRKLAFKYAMHKRYVELHNNKYNYLRQFTKALERTNDPQAAFVEVFSMMEMNFATNGKSDGYFKAIERHFKKEFES